MKQQSFELASQNIPASPAEFSSAFNTEFEVFPFTDGGIRSAMAQAEEFASKAFANGNDQTEVFIVGAFNEAPIAADFEGGGSVFDNTSEFRSFFKKFSSTLPFADFDPKARFFSFSSFGSNFPVSASFMQAFTFIGRAQNDEFIDFNFESFFDAPFFQENFGFPISFNNFIFCFVTPTFR
ncbi:MAG TPA: hypothetical protein VK612_11350 [Pyrinomonadaceae bacterium]|nr:hypothetical protein [Pyrinomonadaceae bacterium]